MNKEEWQLYIASVVQKAIYSGNSEGIELLAKMLHDRQYAEEILKEKGYGSDKTGICLREIAEEEIKDK